MTDLHPITLRFASDELERAWGEEDAIQSLRPFRAAVVLSIVLFGAFIALDRALMADVAGRLLVVRGVASALLLATLAATWLPAWSRLHGWVVAVAILVAGGGIVALLAVGRQEAELHWAGLLLALMAIHGLYQPRIPVAVALSGLLILAFDGVLLALGTIPLANIVTANFFLVSAAIIGSMASYSLERTSRERFLATIRLEEERRLSERLLLNILPEPIARRLKAGEEPIADHHTETTVLFADIAGFTAMTADMDPDDLVELLDEVFHEFDWIARDHGVEKVKTIGDACMMVGGLPEPQEDHAARIAEAAFDIRERVARCRGRGHGPIHVRIGIATGSVVAGVIGRTKFSYDLWGDVVNTASRMASLGETDRIQVTEEVVHALGDRYDFQPRGALEVKGKGSMETWYLERREAAAAEDSARAAEEPGRAADEPAPPGVVEPRLPAKANGRSLVLTP